MTLDELVTLLEGVPGVPAVLTVGETAGALPVVQVAPQRLEITPPAAMVKDVYLVNVTWPLTPFRESFVECHAMAMSVLAGLRNDPGSEAILLLPVCQFVTEADTAQPQMRYEIDIQVRGAQICAPAT